MTNNFNTHHYSKPAVKSSTIKDELTPEQQEKVQQYKDFVDKMNVFAGKLPDMERQALFLTNQNKAMGGLDTDADMLAEVYHALYDAAEALRKWQEGGDQITVLEKQWGLPEDALDY